MAPLFRARGTDFDRLYRDHVASVYRYAFAVLGNHPDAEDVTQQTFLNAYRAIAQGTKPRKAENWLVTIAHNEVRRHFRENGKAVEVELDERLAHPDSERSDPSLADILRALQKLPPTQRSALVMREFEGRSYAEIAQVLELTQSALEALLFRARRGLAEHLEEGLTCAEAEEAVSRRLDGRLARREGRRLRKHLRECTHCVRFVTTQKRQRALLKGLSVMPIPASLYLFRPEPTAAAGLGAAGVAAAGGGSAAVAGGSAGAGALGIGAGLAAKAAAVAAVAAVVGGVGYEVAATADSSAPTAKRQADPAAAALQPAQERVTGAPSLLRRAQPISLPVAKGRKKAKKAKKAKARPPAAMPLKTKVAKPEKATPPGLEKKEQAAAKVRPDKPTKAERTRPERAALPKKPRPVVEKEPKPAPPERRPERPKPPPAELPPLPEPAASVVKKLRD